MSSRIERLKDELVRNHEPAAPSPAVLETFRAHLASTLGAMRAALEAAGKWQAIVDDLTHSPLDELYLAAEGNRGRALTVLGRDHLDEVERHARAVVTSGIPGDFCEAGVFRGGMSILLAAVLDEIAPGRVLWAADSFQGLPHPNAETDAPSEIASWAVLSWAGAFASHLDDVRASFQRLGVSTERVRFVEGWFDHTLPAAPIGALALLRVDCQYEHSTRTVLNALYPKVSPGGRVLLNDYGHEAYWGARRAIDTYRSTHAITAAVGVHGHSGWWAKPL